jgi:acetate kinase
MYAVLVLNTGSSSLKYRLVEPETGATPVIGLVERIGDATGRVGHDGPGGEVNREQPVADYAAALDLMRELLAADGVGFDAVGHRVVHGGPRLVAPTRVDDDVLAEIERLTQLAPLHNPAAVAGIRAARRAWPELPQVAVFDTAFFAGLPAASATYAVDRDLSDRLGLRRYGFHGISHEYVAAEAARFLGRPLGELDQVVLHLGNGASASAIRGGRPVDTSMGLTPLEGLVMGSRGGDVDPGLLLHLLRNGVDVDQLEDLLEHHAGLVGLCGHHDFRDLVAAVEAGDPAARTAYDVYCHRLRKYLGGYLAILGGADAIAFTAGIGEHDAGLRAAALAGLERLGVVLHEERNRAPADGPRRISADESRVEVLVVPTDEELAIARQVRGVLG